MQEHLDDWSNTRDRPPDKKSRTRSMFFRFLFGVSGFVLLTAVAVGAMAPKLVDMQSTYASARHTHSSQTTQSNTSGQATLKLDPNAHTLSIQAKVSNAPSDTPLVMHVHGGGSCTGPILFLLQATSSDAGRASVSMTFSIDEKETTLPNDWFFNVHDTTRQDADGKPLSIACGPIKVASSGLKGRAQLCPVQPQKTVEGLNQTTQSNTSGLTTLLLNPNAHTLSIEAIVFGAPPDTPLVLHVHGGGSCTGSILFPLQATSDDSGHASATMTFNDPQDSTIPNDWFFNVHDTTRQGSDGKPLSIACGPIETIDSTIAFAKLNPVQPTQSIPGNPTAVQTTTQSTTEGITTIQLDPSTHTLAVEAIVFGAPLNTPLVMHIHGGGSCTGPILFPLQATSDNAGNAFATMSFNDPQDTTIPNDWFFNVHDTTRQGPDGKPLSIACGPIQVTDPSGLTGHALMCPVQPNLTTVPTVTPLTTITSPTTAPATQNATQGLTVLYLNSAAHTLTVLSHVVGAPPNTPLTMTIHGGGSCTGPTLFMLQTTSDSAGNATAIMPFNDAKDTTLSNQWFFDVDNATKQGPSGQPLSIACGPIQAAGQVGLAQLNLFQLPQLPQQLN